MNVREKFVLFALLLVMLSAAGCGRKADGKLDAALDLYKQNKLEQALPLFQTLARDHPGDAAVHAWLAETLRRLGKKEDAVRSARAALSLDPRSSFAHTVLADAMNPMAGLWPGASSDSTWTHLREAVACDPNDGNAWLLMWGEAMRRDDAPLAAHSLRRLHETGFLSPAALAYGRWMLSGLPPNAILLTNGDMDTYPPCALQASEGFRTDVTIVNRSLLNTPWYARFLRDHAALPLPIDDAALEALEPTRNAEGRIVTPSDIIFLAWLEQRTGGTLVRPLALSKTVDEEALKMAGENLRFAGAFLECSDSKAAAPPDTAAMRRALTAVSPEAFFGPWVSEGDRSPIRRVYTKNIARNVTDAALRYAEMLIGSRRLAEAERWLTWAERLEKGSEAGPAFGERIRDLRVSLAQVKS